VEQRLPEPRARLELGEVPGHLAAELAPHAEEAEAALAGVASRAQGLRLGAPREAQLGHAAQPGVVEARRAQAGRADPVAGIDLRGAPLPQRAPQREARPVPDLAGRQVREGAPQAPRGRKRSGRRGHGRRGA
jgi:hypothetical protein